MAPKRGKITSFFKRAQSIKKPAETFDEDEILVVQKKIHDAPRTQPETSTRPTPGENQGALVTEVSDEESALDRGFPIDHDMTPDQTTPRKAASRQATPPSSLLTSPLTSIDTPFSIRTIKHATVAMPSQIEKVTSSFASNTSSKRVMVNGQKAVTNSDSDDLDSDDDDLSLPDINTFWPNKRVRLTPPPAPASIGKASAKVSESHKQPPQKAYKHSLASLVQQREADDAQAARLRHLEAEVLSTIAAQTEPQFKQATHLLAEDENHERVMAAISRAEVFQSADIFYFFHGSGYPSTDPEWPETNRIPFPMETAEERQLVFESGAMEAMSCHIPSNAMDWITRRARTSIDHQEAYLRITLAGAPNLTSTKPTLLRHVYTTSFNKTGGQSQMPVALTANLKLMESSVSSLISENLVVPAIVDLFLANADENVRHCIDFQRDIASCLQLILDNISGVESYQAVLDEIIQGEARRLLLDLQMARAIVALPTSTTKTHRFRRQLALHYLFQAREETVDPNDPRAGERLLRVLQDGHPSLRIGQTTDWKLFRMMVRLLDVAIDAGFSTFDFMRQHSFEAEKDFNRRVDELLKELRLLTNNIRDSGASQLNRSEAKAALDSLILRIELSVRTKPRTKSNAFGDGMISVAQKKNFASFFKTEHDDGIESV